MTVNKETIIRLIELSFDNPKELDRVLNEKNITPDAIELRQKAADIISVAINKDEALSLLRDYL